MEFYSTLRYNIIPPAFIVFFTNSVQLLALIGRDEAVTLPAIISGTCGSLFSWTVVLILFFWAFIWLIIIKKEYLGPQTDYGYSPSYKAGGVRYYWISVVAFLCCEFIHSGLSTIIYQSMPQILGTLNILAFVLCIYLYFQPSISPSEDRRFSRAYLFYRGQDLHPRLLGVDVKQLVVSRISLIAWQILVIAFFIASVDRNGFNFPTFVTCMLQTIYLAVFYYWERGYFSSLDIILDRAGYYICWGSLVWVPCFYTFISYYLVSHVPIVSNFSTFLIFIIGLLCLGGNWWANFQRLRFRSSPDGRCVIWGSQARFIKAKYKDVAGRERTSLLLTSGLWGIVRHLNYTFEICHSFAWCYPGLGLGLFPFLYPIFVSILLIHRLFRDEEKCRKKYGQYWDQYCKEVPFRLIPNIF